MNIKNHLRKYGYRPDLSDNILEKYETALFKYLGDERYEDFCEVRDYESSEDVLHFIGNDLKFLKLVLSGQIALSISILKIIENTIEELKIHPKNILELGGADGWAIDFLQKKYHWNNNMCIVDKNPQWETKNNLIKFVPESYKNFHSDTKFDFIFSILGATFNELNELFQCVADNLTENGIAVLGLRIATENEFIQSIKLAHSLNLKMRLDISTKIESLNEKIPVLVLERSNAELTQGDELSLLRKAFNLLDPEKRINGIEAEYFYELIKDGETISLTKREWDNGDFMTVEIIKKNNINYRKTTNLQGDMIIEYPVDIDNINNHVDHQLERMNKEYIYNNTK